MATTTDLSKQRNVRELTFTLTYSDTTTAKMLTLPSGARIIAWFLNVKTAFSGGTAELDVGTSDDADSIMDGESISAVGQLAPGAELLQPGYETTDQVGIYANVGVGNTAGEIDVTVLFSMDVDRAF
jgi:hypothetical protein